MTIAVNEIYGPVLQGEGVSIGTPVLFLRLSGCNLHCSWCDTSYTWNFVGTSFKHDYAPKVSIADERTNWEPEKLAHEIVRRMRECGVKRLVLSGGEPMIQQKSLVPVLKRIHDQIGDSFGVEVETNGTFKPLPEFDHFIEQYNVSPKLKHSGNPEALRERKDSLDAFSADHRAHFKYVVSTPEDEAEVLAQVKKYWIPNHRVMLMPLGHDLDTQLANLQSVEAMCLRNNFRLSPRLHVLMYGNKRGI